MPKPPAHLGTKLAEAIKDAGVNQADVARAFQVKPSTVSSDWLKFGRIGKRHYQRLVTYFGKPYEWWFGDAPTPPTKQDNSQSNQVREPAPLRSEPRPGGPTIASLCGDRRLDAAALAPLLNISVRQAARLVLGEAMPSPAQRQLLGAIFGINPDLITDASDVVARPVPGNARKRTLALDGYEYQLIQQYRHLPEAAQHVLRAHATVLEETFGQRSPQTPFSQGNPPGKTKADPDPPPDSDYGSW